MRSSGPVRAIHYGGADYVAKANDEIVVMGMVETKEGLKNLDAICATPGLDAIYIGPSDLAFALDMTPRPDNPDPKHMATCDQIRDTAHKHGKKACMHCASAAFAAGAGQRGVDLLMLTSHPASMVARGRPPPHDPKGAPRRQPTPPRRPGPAPESPGTPRGRGGGGTAQTGGAAPRGGRRPGGAGGRPGPPPRRSAWPRPATRRLGWPARWACPSSSACAPRRSPTCSVSSRPTGRPGARPAMPGRPASI